MATDIGNFAAALSDGPISEIDTAIALLWYCDTQQGKVEATPKHLTDLMRDLSLRGEVNVSRLARRLAAHASIVKGRAAGTYKLKIASRKALDERYSGFTAPLPPKIDPLIVPAEVLTGTRRYLERLAEQINGSYQYGFYDGCAVLCRRLMETLLIEAFEAQGEGAAIKSGKDYVGLNEIIGTARTGKHVKLARGTADVLQEIKLFGDAAAHSWAHITTQRDVDDVKMAYRRVLSELLALAKIEPRAAKQANAG